MEFEKRRVALSAIRPSGQNPREDFGDIAALARAIEATGGEPVNPPVVVADGNVYRIVDGERSYRALKALYPEGEREVAVLCAAGMDEANELTAMLATDDKERLTDAERARGVQQMLVLGVDEQRIERASRATAVQVRAAKRLAGRVPGGVQVTLEQMEAASAFEDEADVDAVLGTGDWRAKAEQIRRRNEREEALARDYDALGDAGIPALGERPEGSAWAGWAHMGEVASQIAGDGEVARATAAVRDGSGWTFYGETAGEAAKTEDELRAEAEERRHEEAKASLYRRMVEWAAGADYRHCPDLLDAVAADRTAPSVMLPDSDAVGARFLDAISDDPGDYEIGRWLMAAAWEMRQVDSRWGGDDAGGWLGHMDIARRAGFEPTDEDEWLCGRIAAGLADEGKDGDDE